MFIKDKSWGVVERRGNMSQAVFHISLGRLSRCQVKLINQTSIVSRVMGIGTPNTETVQCGYSGERDCLWGCRPLISHFILFYRSEVSKLWPTGWLPVFVNQVLLEHNHTHLNKKHASALYYLQ